MNKTYLLFPLLFFWSYLSYPQDADTNWLDTIASPKEKSIQYTEIALQQYNDGNRDGFKVYNDSALYIAEHYNLPGIKIDALNNIATYHIFNDEYEEALSIYLEALDACNELMPRTVEHKIDLLNNIAQVYNKIGLFEKAIVYAKQIITLSELHNVSDMKRMSVYNILGNSYKRLKEYDRALEYLNKLKRYGESTNNIKATVLSSVNIINIYFNMEDYDSTIQVATEFLESYPDVERGKLEATLNLGMAYVKKEDAEKAIPYLIESKEMAIDQNKKHLVNTSYLYLAEAYELIGNYEKSLKEQKAYAETNKELSQQRADATVVDVKHDAENEKEIVEQELETVSESDTNKSNMLLGSSVAIAILGSMLFFYIRKKKHVEKERVRFERDHDILFNENKVLKTKMKELAEKYQKKHEKEKETVSKATTRYKNSSLTQEDREKLMNAVLDYMEKEKPYLDFDINQSDLASNLDMSSHHLSEVLNFCFEQNFYNFINIYRVNEARKIMKDPAYIDYKILAIGYEAGFKSKTSFNRVFKNHTGLTPSEYRKKNILQKSA
ncbi:tetratricopeptide repeat protein [Galbibacter sp. EGI 63066]|uniref:tetratricopeptide repeat protein n=1 Tax=Galbibacter sp. EGI 63066 TaxID=2993559 RepID=UPI0022499ACD|nr:tetratricopeptide repeat protein [Galbibacter sp. EGI 63066]MCX2679279.1 tetratricopeptide repeat protein [Galbibacter sp. EGI 63066]